MRRDILGIDILGVDILGIHHCVYMYMYVRSMLSLCLQENNLVCIYIFPLHPPPPPPLPPLPPPPPPPAPPFPPPPPAPVRIPVLSLALPSPPTLPPTLLLTLPPMTWRGSGYITTLTWTLPWRQLTDCPASLPGSQSSQPGQ